MKTSILKSILLGCGTAVLALVYILAPLHHTFLAVAHDLEHEFYHITSSSHEHGFLSAEELLAEAGHDHRTLEYIKQVLEPFEDDLKKEQEAPKPLKMDKHIPAETITKGFDAGKISTKASFDLRIRLHRHFALRKPVPPPEG